MKKVALYLAFALSCVLMAAAQTTPITANNIALFGGAKVTGQFCVTPTDQNGNALTLTTPGGQQLAPQTPLCFPIVAGVLSPYAIVPDTALAQPANACYKLTVYNNANVPIGTYPCIQPTSATPGTPGTPWSFDAYVPSTLPSIPALTLPQFETNGVTNTNQGILNVQCTGCTNSGGTVNIPVGSSPIAANTIAGNNTGSSAAPFGLTPTQAAAMLASFFDASGTATSAAATAQSNAEAYSANASNLSSGTVNSARLPTLGPQLTSPGSYVVATGVVNALVATFSPAVTSYVAGLEVLVLPNLANTSTTPTINLNGLGAKSITKLGTAALAAGDMSTTAIADLVYDGTEFQLMNPQSAGVLPSIGPHSFLGNAGASSATAAPVTIGAQDASPGSYVVASGSVNALTATLSPAVTSYVAGLEVLILPNLANTTTTPTINLNGLGAKNITRYGAAALSVGDLSTTAIADLIYDGTEFQLMDPQTISNAPPSGDSGYFSLPGNTANQSVVSNTWGVMGPPTTSYTGWAEQPASSTSGGPSALSVKEYAAVSSNVSPFTLVAPTNLTTTAQCLAAVAPVTTPCVAASGQASGLGATGTTGTLTLYSSSAPAGSNFQFCPTVYVDAASTTGGTITPTVSWVSLTGLASGGPYAGTVAMTAAYVGVLGCFTFSPEVNTTVTYSIAGSGTVTGSPSWEYSYTILRLR